MIERAELFLFGKGAPRQLKISPEDTLARCLGQRNYDAEVIRENDLNILYTLRAVQLESVIAEIVSIDTKS